MKAPFLLLLVALTAALALSACATSPAATPAEVPTLIPTEVVLPATASPSTAGALQPLSPTECAAMADVITRTLGVDVVQGEAPVTDPASGESDQGCQAIATGTGEDFESPSAVVDELSQALEAEGWQTDANLAAGGPTGAASGLRKGSQLALVSAMWQADPAANCPQDQPITACSLTPKQKLYTVTIDAAQTSTGMANPASVNCEKQGGRVEIETRGDGGQIGVCYFLDNLQCEEWALMRGDCPAGGVKVTGYATAAGRYCAITGGTYTISGRSGAADEEGTCQLPDGTVCDAWDYYNGKCSAAAGGGSGAVKQGGGAIVFDSDRGGEYRDLYTMDIGASATRLTQGDASSIAGPWSPDGQRIVYTCSGPVDTDICVINADGTGQVNLTKSVKIDEGFPAWSPDGLRIAYNTRRDGDNEIYVMGADGTGPVRLTTNPADDFAPTWSPDGAQIAFASDRDKTAGVYDVYLMAADGTGVKRLTTGDASIDWPAWSPDGSSFAYRTTAGGQADIGVMAVDGTGQRNVTNTPSDEGAPAWSPDGSRIAFQTNRDANWEVYAMNADGGAPTNLTNEPTADDQQPHWRP